jgi:ankyrin repeat protein
MNALHIAAYNGNAEAVRALLDAGVDPDEEDKDGLTALYWCCFQGLVGDQVPVAEALLDAGCDPNISRTGCVDTPLTAAIASGNAELVALLLERGASPNVLTGQGVSPLMVAGREGSEGLVDLLLRYGANRDIRCEGFTASDYARSYGHDQLGLFIDEWGTEKPS